METLRLPEDHLRRLAGLHQHLPLHAEALRDSQLLHATHAPLVHVQTLRQRINYEYSYTPYSQPNYLQLFYSEIICYRFSAASSAFRE